MIEVRTKKELADVHIEYENSKNKVTDAIEDLEEELVEAQMSTTRKDEVEKEVTRLRKLLTRRERDHELKVNRIKNAAEIEKERATIERQQQ